MSMQQQQGGSSSSSSSSSGDELNIEEILSGYQSDHGDTDYLRQVVNHQVGLKFLQEMQPEFEQAMVLSNRNTAQEWEARQLIRFRTNAFLMEHPPENSKMTGSFRELVYGNDKEPLSPAEVREILAIEEVLLARVTQSRNMEQQRLIKEMRQEQSLTREDTTRSGSSLKERIRGAFKA